MTLDMANSASSATVRVLVSFYLLINCAGIDESISSASPRDPRPQREIQCSAKRRRNFPFRKQAMPFSPHL